MSTKRIIRYKKLLLLIMHVNRKLVKKIVSFTFVRTYCLAVEEATVD